MTTVQPIVRYDAIIEAALNGTFQRAHAANKRATSGSTTLCKTLVAARAQAIPSGPSILVDRTESNLFAQQERQRAEHAERRARTSRNEFGSVGKRVSSDSDAAALFEASRLRRIVPGFYAGVR